MDEKKKTDHFFLYTLSTFLIYWMFYQENKIKFRKQKKNENGETTIIKEKWTLREDWAGTSVK